MKRLLFIIPSLLAIFPSMFLFVYNKGIARVSLYFFLPSLLVIAIAAFLFFLLLKILIKDFSKAFIIACLSVIFIFYYGEFFEIASKIHFGSFWPFDRHATALALWFFTLAAAVIFTFFSKKDLFFVCQIFGIFTAIFFAVFLCFSSWEAIKIFLQKKEIALDPKTDFIFEAQNNSSLGYMPDIYYIVPDGYANSEVLEKFFNGKNEEFISNLESRGFSVVSGSKSNYSSTLFSISTTLNMDYGGPSDEKFLSLPAVELKSFLEEARVIEILKNLEYQYVSISSDNTTFSGRIADKRFGPSLLYRILIRPTIFDPFSERFRSRIMNTFDYLKQASAIAGPKFVVAHILSPHDPYVFGESGEEIGVNQGMKNLKDMELYLSQLKFINKELEKAIDVILKNSSQPPVIIIQSDHGVRLPDNYADQEIKESRFKNFSAYFLPQQGLNSVEEAPIPADNINTFRFIFKKYFGAPVEMLEDRSLWIDLDN